MSWQLRPRAFSPTLARYLVRELLLYSALALLLVLAVMLSQNVVARAAKLFSIQIGWTGLLQVVGAITAMIAAYGLPVAFLFGVILAVSRMCSDCEVLAMRANGVGLRQLVIPVLGLSLGVSLLAGWLLVDVEHRGRQELREILISVAARGGWLEPERFHRMGKRVFYAHRRSRENRLERILISDATDRERPYLVLSESGVFEFDAEREIFHFQLANGEVHVEPFSGDDRYHRLRFETLDYAVDASAFLEVGAERRRPRTLSLGGLRKALAQARAGGTPGDFVDESPRAYELEIHRRFALSFAPIPLALLAVPLGLRRARGARSWGALVCLGLVIVYYSCLTFTQVAAEEGWVHPALAFWVPNLGFLALGIALLRRARRSDV